MTIKPPYTEASFYHFCIKTKESSSLYRREKVYNRRAMLLPFCVGLSFTVHNGRSFRFVKVSEDMLGHKLGEFVDNRAPYRFKKKFKKKGKN